MKFNFEIFTLCAIRVIDALYQYSQRRSSGNNLSKYTRARENRFPKSSKRRVHGT